MSENSKLRMAKTAQRLTEQGLDCVIYATSANFQYLLDWNDYFWQRTCMHNIDGQSNFKTAPDALLVLNADGSYNVCITPKDAVRAPLDEHCVLSYMDQFEDTASKFISGKKIGVGFACRDYIKEMLAAIVPDAEIVDAEDLIADIRCIKDEKEIAILRQNAEFTDAAVAYCIDNFYEGMTSWEAEKLLMDYGFQNGAEDFSFPPTAGFKTRLEPHCTAADLTFSRDDVLKPGTAVAFDVGYVKDGYCSDWGRTVFWGEPSEFIKNGYLALEAGQQHMIESIVPGKTNINELYGFVLEKVTELGYADYLRYKEVGALGHQIGIDCHEHPMLGNRTDFVLQPGMVFASEPKMLFENECYMRVEDMVLVTETGAESLSKFPRDLFVVGPNKE